MNDNWNHRECFLNFLLLNTRKQKGPSVSLENIQEKFFHELAFSRKNQIKLVPDSLSLDDKIDEQKELYRQESRKLLQHFAFE
ncbi:hypothetical protein T02_1260 [Trichinella nativa]|uniref:Uncharacterized protein n=1 Tax=Trichinella nativa TaxID=6335 RepID=A0A0V1LM43_9BILA|nr:hypothetical protein T02_1260 [Trichinella nativa]